VAFKGPPIIKYRLDFGAVPSTVTSVREAAAAVTWRRSAYAYAANCYAAVLLLNRVIVLWDDNCLRAAHLQPMQPCLACRARSKHQSPALSLLDITVPYPAPSEGAHLTIAARVMMHLLCPGCIASHFPPVSLSLASEWGPHSCLS
jgi:hypothetical protein